MVPEVCRRLCAFRGVHCLGYLNASDLRYLGFRAQVLALRVGMYSLLNWEYGTLFTVPIKDC